MSQYKQINIASDINLQARNLDPKIVNSWGIVVDEDSVFVANNGTGTVSQYSLVRPYTLLETIAVQDSDPVTGLVKNDNPNFLVEGKIVELFAVTENGHIQAWNSDIGSFKTLPLLSPIGAVYKGVTVSEDTLYAADFGNGNIVRYDTSYVAGVPFTDDALVAAGYAPFNVYYSKNVLLVSFAKQDELKHDDVKGTGNGYIDVFSPDGVLIERFYNRGPLNSPWGMFTKKDKLYVGNFGDSYINIFNIRNGTYLGAVKDQNCNPISIDGLWGIARYCEGIVFAAGINDEADGLVGILKAHDKH